MKQKLKKGLFILFMPILLFALLGFVIPYLNFELTGTNIPHPIDKKIQIIAHRGASGLAPENTMAAFKKALEYNVDIVELDVHLSKDDSIIVIHDHSVDRTTEGSGDIENLTYAEIKKLDASTAFNETHESKGFASEKVPTLHEVLKEINGQAKVLIELKWPAKGIYKNLVKNVLECIKNNQAEEWVIVQSFEQKYLEEMHKSASQIPLHQLVFAAPQLLPLYHDRNFGFGTFEPLEYVQSVNISNMYLSKSLTNKMHEQNKTVFVYTLDSEKRIKKAIRLGVDGIITNRPDVVKQLLR